MVEESIITLTGLASGRGALCILRQTGLSYIFERSLLLLKSPSRYVYIQSTIHTERERPICVSYVSVCVLYMCAEMGNSPHCRGVIIQKSARLSVSYAITSPTFHNFSYIQSLNIAVHTYLFSHFSTLSRLFSYIVYSIYVPRCCRFGVQDIV